jgi:hypothetical protein
VNRETAIAVAVSVVGAFVLALGAVAYLTALAA